MKVTFTSDNTAGASESVFQAMMEAAQGDAMPYGNDEITAEVTEMLSALFECDLDVFMVSTGTAANVLSLGAITPSWGSVLCHSESHILNDECSAPEFYTGGARLVGIGGKDAKIDPVKLKALAHQKIGDVHSCQPSAVSLSQVTEVGSVYSLEEIRAITDIAKEANLPVHMDGARFANALVSLGCTPAEMTWKAGIDILSFGATKNGTMAAEAIVVFNKSLSKDLAFRRKRGGHLHSKMRLLPDLRKSKVEPILLNSGRVNPNPNERTTTIRAKGASSKPNIHALLLANSMKNNRSSIPLYSTLKRMKLHGPLILTSRKSQ